MYHPVEHPTLVPFDGSFSVAEAPTEPPRSAPDADACKKRLGELREELSDLQRRLYATDQHAVLVVFQAMDAAGKDSTIRHVFRGVNPAGCHVTPFKKPSANELDHDFLWRTAKALPERGRIGVFNRSYYEEALVVRVHPDILDHQKLPHRPDDIWEKRLQSMRQHERHLARNGTVVIKFWLNVSFEEQKQRFLSRIDNKKKNWKFSAADLGERPFWLEYMSAYQAALNATSRRWAPWYAIPADHKPFMRLTVAEILVDTLRGLALEWPKLDPAATDELQRLRTNLENEAPVVPLNPPHQG